MKGMITNARQYRVTKSQAEKFRRAIDAFDEKQALTCGSDPLIVRAQINALKGQQRRLLEELAEFDALRSAPGKKISVSGLEQLPELLIKVRIARELSQKDLAELLGMKEQQIQRYEAERYQSASLHRLADIADERAA